jgi:DnaJ-class molecular chaperone
MLNIDMNASLDTIKAAYRALVRRVHPDKLAYATPAEQAAGEEQAKNANNGYAPLKDPVKRAEYDQTLPRPLL